MRLKGPGVNDFGSAAMGSSLSFFALEGVFGGHWVTPSYQL